MRVGILGAGNLGTALIENARRRVEVLVVRRRAIGIEGVEISQRIEDLSSCDVVLVALKPNDFRENLQKLGEVADGIPVVSFAAGVKIAEMREHIAKPYRAMTNLAIAERGVVACYPADAAEHLKFLDADFIICGSEDELDAMTAYIGSSPAVIAYLIHAMILAAIRDGISFEVAKKVAVRAFSDAARLFERYGLEGMVERIATPAGTTVEGMICVQPAAKALIDAMLAASSKARKL